MHGKQATFHILLALADSSFARPISAALTAQGHTVHTTETATEAASAMRRDSFDAIFVESSISKPDDGLDFARSLLQDPNHPQVIVYELQIDVQHAVAIAKAGAFDYLTRPLTSSQAVKAILEAAQLAQTKSSTHRASDDSSSFSTAFLVSAVPAVQEMASLARMVASQAETNALLVGEIGTGKSVLCALIHQLSAQTLGPCVSVNLLDVTPDDTERRLFASTTIGPQNNKAGALASARNGTLVLSEIGELALDCQPRLLRAIETRKFVTSDTFAESEFKARVLATTARDISSLADQRTFHSPLFYRLASILIRVPSLRERIEDVPRLANALLEHVTRDASRPAMHLSPNALEALQDHTWPGNIREMHTALTRLALLCPKDEVDADAVASVVVRSQPPAARSDRSKSGSIRRHKTPSMPVPRLSGLIAAALDDASRAERERIEAALESVQGHRERAAALLGMSRTTLWTRMRLLGIDLESVTPSASAEN